MHDRRGETLYSRLADWAGVNSGAAAILAPGSETITFGRLVEMIDASALQLAVHGLGRGDRVAVVASRGPETAAAILGVACAAVCVPLHPGAPAAECALALGETRARALVVPRAVDAAAIDAARRMGLPIIDGLPAGRPCSRPAPAADDVALLLRTSGTTAGAKRVPSTHAQLVARADKMRRALDVGPADRCLNVMPMAYGHSLYSALVGSLVAGGSVICPSELDAATVVGCIRELHPTWYSAGATHQQAILDWLRARPEAIAGHRLRFVRSGSAALPPRVQTALEAMLGVPVVETYATSETGIVTASSPRGERPRGSVGRSPDDDVGVMDDGGRLVPPGTVGEVVVRGPTVIAAYDGAPEPALRHGWYHTGDLGRLDADGRLTLTGRLRELINRGGEKVSPAEVDAVLCLHPAVAQAATFGVPHATLGHEVAAAVVLHAQQTATEADLRRHLLERLTAFKVPRRIVVTDAIPVGPTGKVVRRALAAHFELDHPDSSPDEAARPTPLEHTLRALWRDVLGRDDVGPDDDFFLAGGDSLSAVTLLGRIQAELGVDLPLTSLVEQPTIRGLAASLEQHPAADGHDVTGVNLGGTRLPLFGICGRHGYTLRLLLVGRELGVDQPVYGLQPPGMDWARVGCRTIAEMAAHYVGRVRALQARGPYRLLGVSFGGLMAFEMARTLEAAGEEVEFLGLVDTQPTACRRNARVDQPDGALLDAVERELAAIVGQSGAIEATGARVAIAHVRARKAHVLDGAVRCPITYFLCGGEAVLPSRDRRRLWRHLSRGGMRLHLVPGLHGLCHEEPQFSVLRDLLRAYLDGDPPPPLAVGDLFGTRYRLVREPDGEVLRAGDGRVVRVDGNAAQGYCDAILVDEGGLTLQGWATDRSRRRPADRVIAFVDGRYVGQTGCGVRRDDVERALAAPGLRHAGFALRHPVQRSAPLPAAVRMFALSDDDHAAALITLGAG